MKEVFFNDLGNLSERDCKAIRDIMDGVSYYKFEVSWSNVNGNCRLIVKTDYPKATDEEVKNMFMHVLSCKAAGLAHQKKILEEFATLHYQHPEGVVMYEWCNRLFFYFGDRDKAQQVLDHPECGICITCTDPDNWPVASIPVASMQEALTKFREKEVEVYYVRLY